MAFEFKLPDIGEGLVEGEIIKWLVNEGDTVEEDQPLVEVMTDKATVEIPCPRGGTIHKILAAEGETVAVDAPIVVITVAGAETSLTDTSPTAEKSAKQKPTLAPSTTFQAPTKNAGRTPLSGGRPLAVPSVRKFAREQGVDLQRVQGSGPQGRISRGDVEMHLQGAGSSTVEIPLRGLRKKIAAQMTIAKQSQPHFTYVDEIDMTRIVEQRRLLKPAMDKRGQKINFLPFIIQALIPALKKFPLVNSTLDNERQTIIQKNYYNVGVAVATQEGLMVPVVKDADQRDLWSLAAEIDRLATDANNRRPQQEDLKDSTITVSSIGSIGGVLSTPILNHPEAAILGINQIKERPVVHRGQIAIRHMVYVSISCDHRVVDGALAAEFMNELKSYLETPERFLLS